jgi:plastocyanin
MRARSRTTRLAAVTFAAGLALSASGAALAGVDVTIRGSGSSWNPTRVTIGTGDTVRWRSTSGTHTVTAYGGGWSKNTRISSGESTRKTFNSTGRFTFRCTIHSTLTSGDCSGMCGRVVVT